MAFDWNKLWFYDVYIGTHTQIFVGCCYMRVACAVTRHNHVGWFNSPCLSDTPRDPLQTSDYGYKAQCERVKRIIISPISRIILFLLIPSTWPLRKFNISCYCRCFYVACERSRREFLFWLLCFPRLPFYMCRRQLEIRFVCDGCFPVRTHQTKWAAEDETGTAMKIMIAD